MTINTINDLDFCLLCSGHRCCGKVSFQGLIDPPYLTQYDRENIKKVNSTNKKEIISFGEKSNGCIFLSDEGKCIIHNNRPLDCRLFPFDIDYQQGKYIWILYTYYCQLYLKEELIEPLLKIAEKDILPLFRKDELRIYASSRMGLFEKGKWKQLREVNLNWIDY